MTRPDTNSGRRKIKIDMPKHDELHACAMAMLEILIEQKRKFTGDECVALNFGVTMPDNSKKRIMIAIMEKDEE